MAQDIDFQSMLDNFGTVGASDNAIRAIYNIIPRYDNYQLQTLMVLNFFIAKWQLEDLSELISRVDMLLSENRNLSFIGSQNLKSLLSAYTQNELVRGVKINTYNDTSSTPST